MTTDLRTRVTMLVGLAVLGVGLAVAGTTVGATTPLTDTSPSAAFIVSDENITYEQGDQQTTVVENVSQVDHIEIEQQRSGTYQVHTDTEQPVTDSERRRAKAIAQNNATVQQALADIDRYEITVEPIHRLTVGSAQTMNITGFNESSSGNAGEATYTVSVGNQNGTVTIHRSSDYVEDEVSVRIHDSAKDQMYYTVTVDLANETVTDVTEWPTS